MAFRITTQLSRINEIVTAISALAKTAIEQALPDQDPPPWAIALDLMADLAKDELEVVHNSLQSELPGGSDATT